MTDNAEKTHICIGCLNSVDAETYFANDQMCIPCGMENVRIVDAASDDIPEEAGP